MIIKGLTFLILTCVFLIAGPATTAAQPPAKGEPLRPGSVKAQVVKIGKGWQLLTVEGRRANGSRIKENVYRVDGIEGLRNLPLSPELRALLGRDDDWLKNLGNIGYFGESVIKKIEQGVEKAVRDYIVDCRYRVTSNNIDCRVPLAESVAALDAACADEDGEETIEKFLQKSFSKRLGGTLEIGLGGHVDVAMAVAGPVRVKIPYRKKMVRETAGGNCVAIGFTARPVTFSGEPDFTFAVPSVSGHYTYPLSYSVPLGLEILGEVAFAIGTVPVVISFEAVEKAGVRVELTGEAKLAGQLVTGKLPVTFAYTCDHAKGDNGMCDGRTDVKKPSVQAQKPSALVVSGEAAVIPWVTVALRAGLYSGVIDNVYLSVTPYGRASLWGALPTATCDADGNGETEVVTGALFDADVAVRVDGGFGSVVLDYVPFIENPLILKLADFPFHALFLDARQTLGPGPSNVLNPIARLDGAARAGQETRIKFRMNDCYPYADAMDYRVDWGDGSAPTLVTFAPQIEAQASHTYSTPGQKTIIVRAVRDDHATGPSDVGRLIDRAMTLRITVQAGTN